MFNFLFAVVLLLFSSSTGRDQHMIRSSHLQGISHANFDAHKFQHLQGSLLDSSCGVVQENECAFACVDNAPCVSFNVAFSPNENGKLRCELLSEDKYRSPEKLTVSQQFHHYSLNVSGSLKSSCRAFSYFCGERFYQQ